MDAEQSARRRAAAGAEDAPVRALLLRHAPNLGQGANSALVDGAVLLDELRRASTLAEGLTAYERRRRPAVRLVAKAAAQLGRMAEATNPVVRWMRDRMLMPIAMRLSSDRSIAMVMQEPSARLLAIRQGR